MQECSAQDYIDWAVEMLAPGIESRSLRILAGLDPSTSLFEVEDYFQSTCRELSLKEPSKEIAQMAYSLWIAEGIIEGRIPPRDGVKKLFSLCVKSNYPKYLMSWYNLDDGCDDVKYGHEPFACPGLTKENLDATILEQAKVFIQDLRRTLEATNEPKKDNPNAQSS